VALMAGQVAAVNGDLNLAVANGGLHRKWSSLRRGGARARADRPGPRRVGSGPFRWHRPQSRAERRKFHESNVEPGRELRAVPLRPLGLAYRMLGSMADAEDAVLCAENLHRRLGHPE